MSNYEVTFTAAPFCVLVTNAECKEDAVSIAMDAVPRGFPVQHIESSPILLDEVVHWIKHNKADAVIDAGDES